MKVFYIAVFCYVASMYDSTLNLISAQQIVSTCPEDKSTWIKREKIWQCLASQGLFYHCIGTSDNTLVETCLILRSMSRSGQCPFINLSEGQKLYFQRCLSSESSECPAYNSVTNELYKYPGCTNKWQFEESTIPTTSDARYLKRYSVQRTSDRKETTNPIYITSGIKGHTLKSTTAKRRRNEDKGFQEIFFGPLLGAGGVICLLLIIVLKLLCRLRRKTQQTHTITNVKQKGGSPAMDVSFESPVYHEYNEINEAVQENGSTSSESYLDPVTTEYKQSNLCVKQHSYETLPKMMVERTNKVGKENKKSSSI